MANPVNVFEARAELVQALGDLMFDLAGDDEMSGDEMLELRRQMADVADAILEGLGATVVEVKDNGTYLLEVRPFPETD